MNFLDIELPVDVSGCLSRVQFHLNFWFKVLTVFALGLQITVDIGRLVRLMKGVGQTCLGQLGGIGLNFVALLVTF